MRCPKCHGHDHTVTQTRDRVRRTRHCQSCGHTFMTHEGLDTGNLMVEKRDGRIVAFSRKRLAQSVEKAAVNKLPRAEVSDLVTRVVEQLFADQQLYFDREGTEAWIDFTTVTTREIGSAVMDVLHSDPTYRATRMRYGLFLGRSNGAFHDATSFLQWLERDEHLRSMKLPTIPDRVVKRDGTTVPFLPSKLKDSIKFAVQKRPVDEETHPGSRRINEEITRTLYDLILRRVCGQQTVTSSQLAMATTWVLLASKDVELARLMTAGDRELAYLRVASSAKRFTRAEDFQAEAALLVSRAANTVPSGFEDQADEALRITRRRNSAPSRSKRGAGT